MNILQSTPPLPPKTLFLFTLHPISFPPCTPLPIVEWVLDIEKEMTLEQQKILLLNDRCVTLETISRMFSLNWTSTLQTLYLEISSVLAEEASADFF